MRRIWICGIVLTIGITLCVAAEQSEPGVWLGLGGSSIGLVSLDLGGIDTLLIEGGVKVSPIE